MNDIKSIDKDIINEIDSDFIHFITFFSLEVENTNTILIQKYSVFQLAFFLR